VNAVLRALAIGAAAGAAGTTALNAVTYLDMAVRGRPASDTPSRRCSACRRSPTWPSPGEGDARANRGSRAGPARRARYRRGVGRAALARAYRGLAPWPGRGSRSGSRPGPARVERPTTALGVTDPRTWPTSSWVSDILPHLAYGAVAACVLRGLADR